MQYGRAYRDYFEHEVFFFEYKLHSGLFGMWIVLAH
jgi:hypothetical protein